MAGGGSVPQRTEIPGLDSMGVSMPRKRSRGRKALVTLGTGLGFIGAGILVLVFSGAITGQLSSVLGSSTGGSAGANATPYGGGSAASYLPFAVFAFGIGLIGSGGAILRRAVMAPAMGMGSGLSAGPENAMAMMGQQMAALRMMNQTAAMPTGSAAAADPVVKVKCRSCGFLERPDAEFCSKCGKPL